MWSLVPRSAQIIIVIALGMLGTSTLAAVARLYANADPSPYQYISLVATAICIILIPLVEGLWRQIWRLFPFLNRWLFPDLNGTWKGELISTWINPETGQSPPPIPVTFWIRQGIFSMSIRMKTGESGSYSTRCLAEADRKAKIFRIWYTYDNRPHAEVSHRSARHDGAAWLELNTEAGLQQLAGQYFTQRRTSGDIRISRISLAHMEIS